MLVAKINIKIEKPLKYQRRLGLNSEAIGKLRIFCQTHPMSAVNILI